MCIRWWLDVVDRKTLELGFGLFGFRQQGVPVILRELMLPDGFDPFVTQIYSESCYHWTIRAATDICRTEMYLQVTDYWVMISIICIRSLLVQIESNRPSCNVVTGPSD